MSDARSAADSSISTFGRGICAQYSVSIAAQLKDDGNVASASLTYVVVDVTPPTTTIALQPPSPNRDNGWYRSLSIAVNATDPDDPVAATHCKVLPANAPAPRRTTT